MKKEKHKFKTYKQAAEQVIQYIHFYNTFYVSFDTTKYEEFLRKNFKYRGKP